MNISATQVSKLKHEALVAYDEFKNALARARCIQLRYEAKKDDFHLASGAMRFYARALSEAEVAKPAFSDRAEVAVIEQNRWNKRRMYRSSSLACSLPPNHFN